jgi:hypothetical protein
VRQRTHASVSPIVPGGESVPIAGLWKVSSPAHRAP